MDEEILFHPAHGDAPALDKWMALFIAIVAMLAGIVGHESSQVANEAILYKNDAVLKQTKAADQWNFFQATSTKLHLTELAKDLTPSQSNATYDSKITKYNAQKDEIQKKATMLEHEMEADNAKSDALRGPRQALSLALTIFQIAISLGSITILSRQVWLFGFAGIGALAGVAFWVAAIVH